MVAQAGLWSCGPGRRNALEEVVNLAPDPDQGGGAQLCQELFTLTEHAAAHLLTPTPSDSALTRALAAGGSKVSR